MRPLALSAVERRFAERFPGRIARLTDGRQIVVLRDVARPTRLLHPAADCYRGLGYRIEGEQLERTAADDGVVHSDRWVDDGLASARAVPAPTPL